MRTQFPAIFQFPLVQQTRSYFGYNRQKMTCIWTCTSKAKVYSEYKNKSYLKLDVLLILAPKQIIFKTFSLEKLNDLRNVQATEFSLNLQSLVGSQSYLKPFLFSYKKFCSPKIRQCLWCFNFSDNEFCISLYFMSPLHPHLH